MKKLIFKSFKVFSLVLILLCFASCGGSDDSSDTDTIDTDTNVDDNTDTGDDTVVDTSINISSTFGGSLYIDGQYANMNLPVNIELTPGTHMLALGVEGDNQGYYRKEITVEDGVGQDIVFTLDDLATPRTWRVLWLSFGSGQAPGGCETNISQDFIDIAFNNFMQGIESIERNAFNSIEWDIERMDLMSESVTTISFTSVPDPNDWTINVNEQPNGIVDFLENTKGMDLTEYDLISIYWPSFSVTGSCSYPTRYGGLAREIRRNNHSIGIIETPFFTLNGSPFHPNPYTYVHEWLHTVELFYPNHGITLPVGLDGRAAHAEPQAYGFDDEIGLYGAMFRGNIFPVDGTVDFLGMGPEGLWAFNLEDLSRTNSSPPKIIVDLK